MRTRSRSLSALVVCAAGLTVALLAANAASAFRPTVRWILDQTAKQRLELKVKSLKVEQEITLYGREDAPRGLPAPQNTWLMSPSSLRLERELPEGVFVRVWNGKQQLVRTPGGKDQTTRAPADVMAAFLTAGPPAERAATVDDWMKQIQAMKVDTDVVSYARFDGRVCYLIGSKPWEADKPQVWIAKDNLQLVRVVTVRKVEGKAQRSEVQLTGWGSPVGGAWFPKAVEYREGDALVWRAVTRSVKKNDPMDKALFATK